MAKTVSVTISVVTSVMLLRVILSLISGPESRLYALTCLVTEPFIVPVRAVMYKLNIGQNSPIDWSFSITYFILVLLEGLLPVI